MKREPKTRVKSEDVMEDLGGACILGWLPEAIPLAEALAGARWKPRESHKAAVQTEGKACGPIRWRRYDYAVQGVIKQEK
jgi:hypothetical protein